jgi:general secretion pathway protein G
MTLIEIVVVIAILTMLMSAVGVYAVGQLEGAKRKAARMDVRNLGAALDAFYAMRGRYPSASEGLEVLLESRVLKELSLDPWGGRYGYSLEDGAPVVTCLGADGLPGGSGANEDVTSTTLAAEQAGALAGARRR